jgi:hypothetical protein
VSGRCVMLSGSANAVNGRDTELDVIDPDENDVVVWVRCEDCDDAGPLEDMQRQYDSGAWLCWDCDSRQRREWDEQMQYLDSIRWS